VDQKRNHRTSDTREDVKEENAMSNTTNDDPSGRALLMLLDHHDIQSVIARYALGQDRHQGENSDVLEDWDEVFTEDAVTDYSAAGASVGSYRDLWRWMRGDSDMPGRMSGFSNWQHMLSLPVITIDADQAQARTDYLAVHRGRAEVGSNFHFNASGAFHDSLVRTPKGWRIRHRRLEVYFGDALQIIAPAAASGER
jgi:hypothetical protein